MKLVPGISTSKSVAFKESRTRGTLSAVFVIFTIAKAVHRLAPRSSVQTAFSVSGVIRGTRVTRCATVSFFASSKALQLVAVCPDIDANGSIPDKVFWTRVTLATFLIVGTVAVTGHVRTEGSTVGAVNSVSFKVIGTWGTSGAVFRFNTIHKTVELVTSWSWWSLWWTGWLIWDTECSISFKPAWTRITHATGGVLGTVSKTVHFVTV